MTRFKAVPSEHPAIQHVSDKRASAGGEVRRK
jgi:hypothetical protein